MRARLNAMSGKHLGWCGLQREMRIVRTPDALRFALALACRRIQWLCTSPQDKKPGRLRKPVRFLDSVSLLVRQRLRLPRKTPSHSKRAKGSTQQHHCCAAVRNPNTLRRKRMALGPSLANGREHNGTNRCNEQGDFSGGD